MVGRVEWGRHGGDDVEATVAMMINREHPNSVRITPSQGDGGVDILDRGAHDAGDVVYQVKRHASALTASQKAKIAASLARLLDPAKRDPRWADLTVAQWRLVMPWDPTPEAEHWLQDLGRSYGVAVAWDGLTTIDQLAAKYPDVADYYLHGGKSAVTEAYARAMALMSLSDREDAGLQVSQVVERIQQAFNSLDHDPHYRYELHLGQGELPAPIPRPGLVISCYHTVDQAEPRWYQVDVIARCAASVDERPITIAGTLVAPVDSDFARDVRDFLEFGTPFTSPKGSFSGHLDAPGGLGGKFTEATVRSGPAADSDLGDNTDLVLAIIDPADQLLAEVNVSRTDRSRGSKGLRVVLTETNGVFEFVHRFNLADQSSTQRLTMLDVTGKPVTDVLAGVQFLASYRNPNRLRVRVRQLPASHAKVSAIPPVVADQTNTGNLEQLSRVLRALARLQEHTDTVLTLPDLNQHAAQIPHWMFAAAILAGETVTTTLKDGDGLHLEVTAGWELPAGTFSINLPLTVQIGERPIDVGRVHATLTDAELHSTLPGPDGHNILVLTTADRTVTYGRPGALDAGPPGGS